MRWVQVGGDKWDIIKDMWIKALTTKKEGDFEALRGKNER